MQKESTHTEKYIQLVNTARKLLTRYGIKRVSVEEICEKAHVSKMTFYKYFRNKNDITDCVLKEIIREGREKYDRILDANMPYADKVRHMIELKIEYNQKFGDEFFTDILKFMKDDLGHFLHTEQQENMRIFIESLINAQKKGEIRPDLNPEFLIYMLNQMIVMAEDPQLTQLYPNHTERISVLTHFFFYGVMPNKR